MTKEVGRLNSFGLGIETTRGTGVPATIWIPTLSANITPMTESVDDTSAFGRIEDSVDSHIAKQWAEFTAEGIVRSQSIGYLLALATGTRPTATLVETSVYSHTFVIANNNQHPSATIIRDNATQEEESVFQMIDTLGISVVNGEQLKFNVTMAGKVLADTTGNTPSFLTGTNDEIFKVCKTTVKFATNIAGLSGASAIELQSFNFEIAKNLFRTWKLGDCNFASQENQQFTVTGDYEAIYEDDTFKDLYTDKTSQAMEIEVIGETLIGATEFNKLTIQLAKATPEEWDRSGDVDAIVNQTAGFTARYSLADSQMLNIVLQNVKSTDY
jgi:hypothetical protein